MQASQEKFNSRLVVPSVAGSGEDADPSHTSVFQTSLALITTESATIQSLEALIGKWFALRCFRTTCKPASAALWRATLTRAPLATREPASAAGRTTRIATRLTLEGAFARRRRAASIARDRLGLPSSQPASMGLYPEY